MVYKSSNIFSEMHVVFLWFFRFFMQLLVYTHINEGSSVNLFSLWIDFFPNSNPRLYFCIMLISQKSSKQDLSLNPNEKDHHFVTSTIIKYHFLFLHGEKMDQECFTFTLLYEAKVVKGSLDFFTCPLSLLMFIIWHRLQPPNDWETHHKRNCDHLYNMITNQVLKGSMDIP